MQATTQAVQHSYETMREATAPKQFIAQYLPLELETRTHVSTAHAAFLLLRRSQTLRGWACLENGPLRPMRIHGRLAWPVSEIKRVLGVA